MKRDCFSVKTEGTRLRITSRRKGITEIYRIDNNVTDLLAAKERHKTKKVFSQKTERSTYVPPPKEEVEEIDPVEYFYMNLEKKDYFSICNFSIQLYDSEGDHCFIFDCADQEYKESIQLAKFYLVENKFDETRFDEDENIVYYNTKQLRGGHKILLILPNITFRDNRFAFTYPKYLRQITLNEVKTMWKNVFNFTYNSMEVLIDDIPKTRKSRNKKRNVAREKAILLKKAKRLYKKVTTSQTEYLKSNIMIKVKTTAKPVGKYYRMQNKMLTMNHALDNMRKF